MRFIFPRLCLLSWLSVLLCSLSTAADWNAFGPKLAATFDVAVSPTSATIVTLDPVGLQRSTDDGGSFDRVSFTASGEHREARFGSDGTLWVLCARDLLRSDDDGATFHHVTPSMPPGVSMAAIVVDPVQPDRVLIGHADPGAVSALRVSETRDRGVTWTDITPSLWDTQVVRRCDAIAVDDAGGGRLALGPQGGEAFALSQDDGQTWSAGATFFGTYRALFAGQALLTTNDDGIWQSTDGGQAFALAREATPTGTAFLSLWAFELESTGGATPRLWGDVAEYGLGYSDDFGATFQFPLPLGRNFRYGKFELDGARVLVASRELGLVRVTDGQPGYEQLQVPAGTDSPVWVQALAIDPANGARMSAIAGYDATLIHEPRFALSTSDDGGTQWVPQLVDRDSALSVAFDAAGSRLAGFRAVPDALGSEAAAVMVEGPTGWAEIGPLHPGADLVHTRSIAASATRPGHYLVVQEIANAGQPSEAQMWTTLDGGATWTLSGSDSSVRYRGMATTIIEHGGVARGFAALTAGNASFSTRVYAGDLGATAFSIVEFGGGDQFSVGPMLTGTPAAPGRVWFGRAGSSIGDTGKLRYSDDGGTTWAPVGLPLRRFDSVRPSKVEPDRLYRIRDNAVWTATLPGLTWQEIPTASIPPFIDGLEVLASDAGVVAVGRQLVSNLIRPDLSDPVCSPGVVNSTGAPGGLEANGTGSVSNFVLNLRATSLPSDAFGIFLASPEAMTPQVLTGAVGRLCLGTPRVRVGTQVFSTGATGRFEYSLDPNDLDPAGGVLPGSDWFFQAWHRDSASPGLGATSNLTHAVRVAFIP